MHGLGETDDEQQKSPSEHTSRFIETWLQCEWDAKAIDFFFFCLVEVLSWVRWLSDWMNKWGREREIESNLARKW